MYAELSPSCHHSQCWSTFAIYMLQNSVCVHQNCCAFVSGCYHSLYKSSHLFIYLCIVSFIACVQELWLPEEGPSGPKCCKVQWRKCILKFDEHKEWWLFMSKYSVGKKPVVMVIVLKVMTADVWILEHIIMWSACLHTFATCLTTELGM